jgi:hypothetical protein
MPQPPKPYLSGPGVRAGPALPLQRAKPPGNLVTAPVTQIDFLKLPLPQPRGFAGGGIVQRALRIRPRATRDYAKR